MPLRYAAALIVIASLFLVGIPVAPPGAAQAASDASIERLLNTFPEGMTPAQIDAILATTPDEHVRSILRERLLAESRAQAAAPAGESETFLVRFGERRDAVVAAYARLPQSLTNTLTLPRGEAQQTGVSQSFLLDLLAIGAGGVAFFATRRAVGGRRRFLSEAAVTSRAQAARRLGLRLILDSVEIAAFVIGVLAAYVILRPANAAALVLLFVVVRGVVIVLVVAKLARFLCDPDVASLRLIPLADAPARGLYHGVVTTVLLTVIVMGIGQVFAALGLPPDELVALGLPLSLVPFLYLLQRLWRRRTEITAVLATELQMDPRQTPFLNALPAVGMIYLVALWCIVAIAGVQLQASVAERALVNMLLILVVPFAAWLIRRPIAHFYGAYAAENGIGTEIGATRPQIDDRFGDILPPPAADDAPPQGTAARSHVSRLMRAVWAVLLVLLVSVTARIWGFDLERHLGFGSVAVRVLFNVGVILLLGYVGWAIIVHAIERALANARRESRSTRAQRITTQLPLLRKFLQIVCIGIVALVVLGSLGVEILPLLAGAGVAGIAIGLGAQQTIADILAGFSFLLEDAFHFGDDVEVGNLRGKVEGISLRSLKLRHHRGAVHILPFGQMKSLTNYTRDWALVRLEFLVAPNTDLDLIKRLIKELGEQLRADPDMGPRLIQTLKSQGVRRVEDDALLISIKYIARPGHQYLVRREAYRRIIAAFAEHGIELVGRGVMVKVKRPDRVKPAAPDAAAAEAVDRKARG